VTPDTVTTPFGRLDFHKGLENKIKSVLKPAHEDWQDELDDYEGFIDRK